MTSPVADIFDIVDENDRVIGSAPRSVVHEKGYLHRASHIWVFNSKGQYLMQKRSRFKDLNPLTYTSSVSGHVDTGETYEEAAVRETWEEIGAKITTAQLTQIGYSKPCEETGSEFVRVYRMELEGPFTYPGEEVEDLFWMEVDKMEGMMDSEPESFCPSFFYLWHTVPQT